MDLCLIVPLRNVTVKPVHMIWQHKNAHKAQPIALIANTLMELNALTVRQLVLLVPEEGQINVFNVLR